ncbi:MAG: hypothetical protein QME87_09680 [Bacillota bacterium]|nr:hypothetical protein [Bacillota bacterium]
MEPEAISKALADLAREHAPEVTFSPPVQVGETTVICASAVSCLAGSRGPNLVITLRSAPCAVIVLRPGECSVLPIGTPGLAERLLDLVPRLLDLLPASPRTGSTAVPPADAPTGQAPVSPVDTPTGPTPVPPADTPTGKGG